MLDAEIVVVISNHANGGVKARADKLGIPFIHFPAPWSEDRYRKIIERTETEFALLSGWLKKARGLDPQKTINIHPGPLPEFGGKGMHGHHVHEAVLEAFKRREITRSAVTMHFATKEYDEGPVFFRYPVRIEEGDTPNTLGARVNKVEHVMQPWVTDLVLQGLIHWDGKDPKTLTVPKWYPFV